MSESTVIGDIGRTLKILLETDPWTGIIPIPDITLKSPKEIMEDAKIDPGNPNKVSIFLYQISESAYLKNQEPYRIDHSVLRRLPPLTLDLSYLVTPYSADKTDEKIILGKVMQIFAENAILSGTMLQGAISGTDEEMRLYLNPISLDDLTKVWSAFQDVAYRLSVCYLVTPVNIDPIREASMQRVITTEMNNAIMVPKSEE